MVPHLPAPGLAALVLAAALAVPATAPAAVGPALSMTTYDGVVTQAGKRKAVRITSDRLGRFDAGDDLPMPRGHRCGRPGTKGVWRYGGSWDDVDFGRGRWSGTTFTYHRFWRHPQYRTTWTQDDVRVQLHEGGRYVTARYRTIMHRPTTHCDSGWVTAKLAEILYTGRTSAGDPLSFRLGNRGGAASIVDATIPMRAEGCVVPSGSVSLPDTQLPATVVPAKVEDVQVEDGRLSEDADPFGVSVPAAGDVWSIQATWLGGTLPTKGYGTTRSGPARLSGTLESGWAASGPCPRTTVTWTATRLHPELAL